MSIRIENRATIKAPANLEPVIQKIIETVPKEHLRGIIKIVLVDKINPQMRIDLPAGQELPGLYHPKMGPTGPWCEIALGALIPQEGFWKKLAARMNFKPNLAQLLLMLFGQHFQLTQTHGVKKTQLETGVRKYTEKYYEVWRESEAGFRAKLFKPLRPYIDKWTRNLAKKYAEEQKKKAG
ncbi:MAG: hypothetical protein ACKV2V_03925 [Blastocatellia bacterium]